MHLRRGYILLYLLMAAGGLKGQILDDTTKLAYGPSTTRYTIEEDLRFNNPQYRIIDTTLFSSYRKNKVELYNYYYQNLGLEGTALRPIFYQMPSFIGVSPGFDSFQPFYVSPEDIHYYDTRSPYSRMTIFLGGENRAITDVEFSRSDSINFNFGFEFKKYGIDKQIDRLGRGDRSVESTQYDIYAQVRSSNLRYQLMTNFSRTRHQQFENGGIDTTGVGDFYDNDVASFLQNAVSDELRQGLHLYHQYSIRDHLEIYNTLDKYNQSNEYRDNPLSEDVDYYNRFYIDPTQTLDSTDYSHTQIELGLKGTLDKLYYNGYWKRKRYDFVYKYADSDTLAFDSLATNPSGVEKHYGFHVGYKFKKDLMLLGGLEIVDSINFEAYAQFTGKQFGLEYSRGKYKPTFLQQAYLGNHRFWINDFRSVFADSFRGHYTFDFKKIQVTPTMAYDLVTDYIYFNKDTLPAQNPGNASILSSGIKLQFRIGKHFVWDANLIYTMLNTVADSTFAIPEVFVYTRFYYDKTLFSGNLESFLGVDMNYKSAYYGPAYDPVVQQFYLQDQTLVEGYPVVNLFLNFKISRFNFFLKYNNIIAAITSEGYMVSPLYRGLPPVLDFGFTWWFFD